MRDEIEKKLKDIDSNIFYGIVPEEIDLSEWNYFVHGMKKIRKSGTSNVDFNRYFYVTIVREDYIDDETIFKVIEKICEIPGMRLADVEYEVDYAFKGKTDLAVEMLELIFTKPLKGSNFANT